MLCILTVAAGNWHISNMRTTGVGNKSLVAKLFKVNYYFQGRLWAAYEIRLVSLKFLPVL